MSAALQRDREPLEVARRRVVVLGLARSGRAAAELLHAHGAQVVGIDEGDVGARAAEEAWTHQVLEALYTRAAEVRLDDAALVVLSPGVPRTHSLVRAARRYGTPYSKKSESEKSGTRLSDARGSLHSLAARQGVRSLV